MAKGRVCPELDSGIPEGFSVPSYLLSLDGRELKERVYPVGGMVGFWSFVFRISDLFGIYYFEF
jgi:hypothetical protein